MTGRPAGPPPMTNKQRDAFTLHCEGLKPAQISERLELRPAEIAAAVDLARLHARLKLQPAQPTAAVAARPARGSRPAPPHDLVEKNRVLTETIKVLRAHIAKCEKELAELRAAHPQIANEPAAEEPVAEPAPAAAAEPEPEPALRAALAPVDEAAIRIWALAEGWTVPPDCLPGAIVLAYRAAMGGTQ